MSRIDAAFVQALANGWHGIELDADDAANLAAMLAAMDQAAEIAGGRLRFESEPPLFDGTLRRQADPR